MSQDLDTLLTEVDVSRWLRVSLAVLQRLRSSGNGPRFVQLSRRRIGYQRDDVEAWLATRTTDRVGGVNAQSASRVASTGENV